MPWQGRKIFRPYSNIFLILNRRYIIMTEQCREKSAASSTEIEHDKRLPKYESPEIKVYTEEELLKNVAVLGISGSLP
jgi:hypothetical protein